MASMSIIEIRNLCKNFQITVKKPGLGGAFRALFTPEIRSVKAVDSMDLHVEAGATLASIGPKGGKIHNNQDAYRHPSSQCR